MKDAILASGAGLREAANAISGLTAAEEAMLTVDVSDAALEIAGAGSVASNFTWGVCTLDQAGCPS